MQTILVKKFESDARIASTWHRPFLGCRSKDDLPDVNVSTMKQCINQVCLSDPRGGKAKDLKLISKLGSSLQKDWVDMSSEGFHYREDGHLHPKTHFASRFAKLGLFSRKWRWKEGIQKCHT